MRLRREHLLYHGTLLYDFPLDAIGRCLACPRQPGYRQARSHAAFVANLPLDAAVLRPPSALAWAAGESRSDSPQAATHRLVAEKYSRREWNE